MRTFLLFALMGTITLLTISAKSATVKTPIDGKRASSLSFSEQANGSGLTLQPQLHFTGKESAKERFAKIKAYQLARQEVETFSDNDIPLSAPVVPCNTADSLALVDLFNTTDGASWTNKTFWLAQRVTLWYGVDVNASGRVIKVDLSNNNLSGNLPPSIGNMSYLSQLFLSGNHITGSLPSEIGNISELYELILDNNSMTGEIPVSIGAIPYLYWIDLSNNAFSGNFPTEIGSQPDRLLNFFIANNQFTGNVLSSLTNQNYLEKINISGNEFAGNLPAQIGTFTSLVELHIDQNNYTFKNIEPVFSWSNYSRFSSKFTYANQSNVGVAETLTVNAGDDLTITVLNYQNGTYDHFQWYHNDVLMPGKTSKDLLLSNVEKTDRGSYYCQITNTLATGLILNSEVIEVEVLGGNNIPVAIAGPDQSVNEGDPVQLDGSASYDSDLDPITYEWEPPLGITLSDKRVENPTFTAPEVRVNTNFEIILYVNDGFENSLKDTVIITVQQVNVAPVANAGSDQLNVREGRLTTLNGALSYDFDEDPLTYNWSAPVGIVLSDSTIVDPTFDAPRVSVDTTFTIKLVVSDGLDDSAPDSVDITVINNIIPVANAGPDQSIREENLVFLDASSSSDAENDTLTYFWTAPEGITLIDDGTVNPSFLAPKINTDSTVVIILRVNDGYDDSYNDTVLISLINNLVPIAVAGPDQTVSEGDMVTLDGTNSSDPEIDPLFFIWTAPEGIELDDNNAEMPTFTAPEVSSDTQFEFILIVNDGYDNSTQDTVFVTVQNSSSLPPTLAIENVTVGLGQTNCYDALQTITVAGNSTTVTFQNGSTVEIIAGQRINFLPGFHAQSGSVVHAHISATFCNPPASIVQIDTKEKGVVIAEDIRPEKAATGIKEVKVYPNPTTGKFTVELTNYNQPVTVSVYNMRGSRVAATTAGNAAEFDMGHLAKGLYMVQVAGDNTVQTKKIMIE